MNDDVESGLGARKIRPVILAAGAGSRLGRDKATVKLGGIRNLERIVATCSEAGLAAPIVVTGAHAAHQQRQRWRGSWTWVVNPDWAQGRTGSLALGFNADGYDARGYLVWPVDVPLPTVTVVRRLIDACPAVDEVAVPCFEGHSGHPLIVGRAVARKLGALPPDASPRPLLRNLGPRRRRIPVATPTVLWDIDTPADLARLESYVENLTPRSPESPNPAP